MSVHPTHDKAEAPHKADALPAKPEESSQAERDMRGSNPNIPPGPRMENLGGRVLESINEPPKPAPTDPDEPEDDEDDHKKPAAKHPSHKGKW